MNEQVKGILSPRSSVNGIYTVLLLIKKGVTAETYRVKGTDGKLYFLKLFSYSKIPRSAFDHENNLLEVEILRLTHHKNISRYCDSGEIIVDGTKFIFLVLQFIPGETLSERIARESFKSYYDIKQAIIGILEALSYLHTLSSPIIHNEITPQNVMLDLSEDILQTKIIDFGNARLFHQSTKTYNKEGINLNYVASECLNGLYSPQSDIYSVGAVMYLLLYGLPPWFKDISKYQSQRVNIEELVLQERQRPLLFPDISDKVSGFEESAIPVIKKALHNDPARRFKTAAEFMKVLSGEIELGEDDLQTVESNAIPKKKLKAKKSKGTGFDAIAGMTELKEQMKLDVIDALNNPSEYEKYGITIPNGMLLYGPPGCGKTFFAKHFAEEVGFNFVFATPSTLKSRYVNATQENIAKMFAEAEANAPTIIFIDEINELLPNRDGEAHEMSKSAVNEMLAQMDRTGEKGIFVIGATNYPDSIDPAMLRAGRLDKKFYLPPPDREARRVLFEMCLKGRPLDFGIDYEKLADFTENYISADITDVLVPESARLALKLKSRISQQILEEIIGNIRPSISVAELKKYEIIRAKMEGELIEQKNARNQIGFKPPNQ